NVPGINVVLLYPSGKVSEIQEKQLTTVGNNVAALEVSGTFDDCQRMVKEAFLDQNLRKEVALSSANSINISRLIPQSFYYFNAYAQLKRDLAYNPDWRLVFSVPSGNFGNLCGGLIAQQMGLPIDHIIASTNVNDVVPEYLETGKFAPRPSVQTISNAMDVGNPSNFARLQAFYGYPGSDEELLDSIQEDISGNRFSDDTTKQAIQEVYENYYGYTMCPHTAVGYLGLKDYLNHQPGRMNGVVLATAHPAKFKDTVEEAVGESIPLPETLKAVLNQLKQATSISPDYEALKTYLMDR
ncbi:MAG: threonine synthase, partial [Bacteroidota bacterium]